MKSKRLKKEDIISVIRTLNWNIDENTAVYLLLRLVERNKMEPEIKRIVLECPYIDKWEREYKDKVKQTIENRLSCSIDSFGVTYFATIILPSVRNISNLRNFKSTVLKILRFKRYEKEIDFLIDLCLEAKRILPEMTWSIVHKDLSVECGIAKEVPELNGKIYSVRVRKALFSLGVYKKGKITLVIPRKSVSKVYSTLTESNVNVIRKISKILAFR